jgi:LysM repeat protein
MKLSNYLLVFGCVVTIGLLMVFNLSYAEDKAWTYNGVEYRVPATLEGQLPQGVPESYEVVAGDTLWGISAKLMTNPLYWPLIWQENLQLIPNPHLIFPGQQLKLPSGTMIAAGSGPSETAQVSGSGGEVSIIEDESAETEAASESDAEARVFKRKPVASKTLILSSGYITKDILEGPRIIASENESVDLSTYDIIFIDAGTDKNFEPEEEFSIIRRTHKVFHPISGSFVGWKYNIVGICQAICVNEFSTMAKITRTYDVIGRGDWVVKREEIPVPLAKLSPPTDICNPSTKQLPGTIIEANVGGPMYAEAISMGRGDIAYIDLGSKDGVAPGYYFTIFHHNPDNPALPRFVAGEAMVLKVTETTATVLLTQSRTAVFIGDQIELKQ